MLDNDTWEPIHTVSAVSGEVLMAPMLSSLSRWLLSLLLLLGLPLLGLAFSRIDIQPYLEFPPLTRYVDHAPFSGWAFAIFSLLDLLMAIGLVKALRHARRHVDHTTPIPRNACIFPVWGWLGVAIMLVGWLLAWSRFSWFDPLQAHTFCMPWAGYIIWVNALCIRLSGRSLMTDTPLRFLLLWPVSALFWWFFEYLNRFVQNWYYVGLEGFSSWEYFFHASLAFATVLPAVLSTHRLLLTFRVVNTGLTSLTPLPFVEGPRLATGILFIACGGLALMGRYPDYLYPLVWAAPLLVFTSLQTLWGHQTIFNGITTGDWRAIIASATAALLCGFFWELWNYRSLARWEYVIPFVDRFHIFEMPILGFGGYLPFGLECLFVGKIVIGNRHLMLPAPDADGPTV